MARIKLLLPAQFSFTCIIPVRITDINYGGHLGNDTMLSLIHEARMQFLMSMGFSEMDLGGTGIIMRDVAIEFRNELFYGDNVIASVAITDLSKIGFELFYKLEKESGGKRIHLASAVTNMICYDYKTKKIVGIPEGARTILDNSRE
jgi:acyl-CoA thioester hydrolase